jgi:hypothetical protein
LTDNLARKNWQFVSHISCQIFTWFGSWKF